MKIGLHRGVAKALYRISILLPVVFSLLASAPPQLAEAAVTAAATAISAGGTYSCALTTTGAMKCWGRNLTGQLGNGTTNNAHSPVEVSILSTGIQRLSAGMYHTCVVTSAGGVQCWGQGVNGELGDGSGVDSYDTPISASGLSNVVQVANGDYHTCALTSSGTVWCWGKNNHGQLGDGTLSNRYVPTLVPGLSSVKLISAGEFTTCAVTTAGAVKCWGFNGDGELGDGTQTDRNNPRQVLGLTSGVAEVVTGDYHSCARMSTGRVKCWGANGLGELGDGTTALRLAPVNVQNLTGAAGISLGNLHTCAVISGGSVKCWGGNMAGMIGDGTTTDRHLPTTVTNLTSAIAVSSGSAHTCALLQNGSIKCWGMNNAGQLGDGSTTNRNKPVNVAGFAGNITISGSTAVGGVTISYVDGTSKIATSDSSGHFSISVSRPYTGTLKATKDGYTFSPRTRSYTSFTSNVTDANFTATRVKPPLVLVHGWLGAQTLGDDCDNGIGKYAVLGSSDVGNIGHVAEWFNNDYQVWLAHYTTSGIGTHAIEYASSCVGQQLEQVYQQNPQPITIVAHSLGGLVSRAAIRQVNPPAQVKALYTLGSPHAGLPTEVLMALIGPEICELQTAACQMSTAWMPTFNAQNPNAAGVEYAFIGGDGGSGLLDGLLRAFSQGPNDGLIGQHSAVGWVYPTGGFSPAGWASASLPGQYFTNETHPALSDAAKAYYVGSTDSESYACLHGLMQEPPDASNCNAAAASPAPVGDLGPLSTGALAFTPLKTGSLLSAGQSVSLPLVIDSTGPTSFYLFWKIGSAPTFTLTKPAPGFEIIDPAYAAAHPAEVIYQNIAATPQTEPLMLYSFPAGTPGIWYVNVIAANYISYRAFAVMDTTRTLSVQTDAAEYSPGDTVNVTVNLTSGGTGFAGATVTGVARRMFIGDTALSFTDQGDGSYTASYVIPSDFYGYIEFEVIASGTDGGNTFSQQEHTLAGVRMPYVAFTGSNNAQPVDANSDGYYERLDFSAGVSVTGEDRYAVSAELYSGSELITRAAESVYLAVGTPSISLPFDGSAIRASGLDGPYTVRNLSIAPVYRGITADAVSSALTTSPYLHTQFGEQAHYTISGNVKEAGATLNYDGGYTVSDAEGNYFFSVPIGWTGTVTPVKLGATFSPASHSYDNVMENQEGENFVVLASAFSATPASKNFSLVKVGTTSAPQAFSVTNAGTGELLIEAISLAGTNASQFQITSQDCAGSALAPAATCSVQAVFAPMGTGARSAYIRITDSAAGSPHKIKLSGNGAAEVVLNGGFNTYSSAKPKIPAKWSAVNFAVPDGKDTLTFYEGTASVRIANTAAKSKTLTQTLSVSGGAGKAFLLSLWVRGQDIPATAGVAQAQVMLYNGTTLVQTKTITLPTGTYDFSRKQVSFNSSQPYTKVVIKLAYSKAGGTIWFDGLSLLRVP